MQYAAMIAYVGTGFCGFQIQPNVRTVQGILTEAFSRLFGVKCEVSGCSRTDSGVHALAAWVSVRPSDGAHRIPPKKIPQAIAPFLPWDLCVREVFEVPDTFHIRHDVLKKRYVYLLHAAPVRDPFFVGRAWQFPYPFPEGALQRMREAAAALVGRHDFSAFMSSGSEPSMIFPSKKTRRGIAFPLKQTAFFTTWCASSSARSWMSAWSASDRSKFMRSLPPKNGKMRGKRPRRKDCILKKYGTARRFRHQKITQIEIQLPMHTECDRYDKERKRDRPIPLFVLQCNNPKKKAKKGRDHRPRGNS